MSNKTDDKQMSAGKGCLFALIAYVMIPFSLLGGVIYFIAWDKSNDYDYDFEPSPRSSYNESDDKDGDGDVDYDDVQKYLEDSLEADKYDGDDW